MNQNEKARNTWKVWRNSNSNLQSQGNDTTPQKTANYHQHDPPRDLQSTVTPTTPFVTEGYLYNDQEDLVVNADLQAGHSEMTDPEDNVTRSDNDQSSTPTTPPQGVEESSWQDDTLLGTIVENMVIPEFNDSNLHMQRNEGDKSITDR